MPFPAIWNSWKTVCSIRLQCGLEFYLRCQSPHLIQSLCFTVRKKNEAHIEKIIFLGHTVNNLLIRDVPKYYWLKHFNIHNCLPQVLGSAKRKTPSRSCVKRTNWENCEIGKLPWETKTSALSCAHGSRVHTQLLRSHREWTKSVQVTAEASKKGQQRGCGR